jgi:hypothetical protein
MNSLEFVRSKAASFKTFIKEEVLPNSKNKQAVEGYLGKLDYLCCNTLSLTVAAGMFKRYLDNNSFEEHIEFLATQFEYGGDINAVRPKIELFARMVVDVVHPPKPVAVQTIRVNN